MIVHHVFALRVHIVAHGGKSRDEHFVPVERIFLKETLEQLGRVGVFQNIYRVHGVLKSAPPGNHLRPDHAGQLHHVAHGHARIPPCLPSIASSLLL